MATIVERLTPAEVPQSGARVVLVESTARPRTVVEIISESQPTGAQPSPADPLQTRVEVLSPPGVTVMQPLDPDRRRLPRPHLTEAYNARGQLERMRGELDGRWQLLEQRAAQLQAERAALTEAEAHFDALETALLQAEMEAEQAAAELERQAAERAAALQNQADELEQVRELGQGSTNPPQDA